MYPNKLNKIINLFESTQRTKDAGPSSNADNAKKQEPRQPTKFELDDVRKDEECTDTVGVYLYVDEGGKRTFA